MPEALPREPTGKCALCFRPAVLQASHFLPQAVYKHVRDPGARNPHPVLFSMQGERQSSKQAWKHLLCRQCEELFHSKGEDWTLAHTARQSGEFKLREILLAQTAHKLLDDMHVFCTADIPSVNADALCYFTVSVIWRATACSWSIEGRRIQRLSLGKYAEPIRLFLLGETPFPSNVVVTAVVSSLSEPRLMITMPQSKKLDGYTSHFFSIPGVDLTIDVGGRIPKMLQEMCLHGGLRRPIFYSPVADIENVTAYLRQRQARKRHSGIE